MGTRKYYFIGLVVAFLLSACSAIQTTSTASPTTPVESEVQPVLVDSVEVRIGVGSPIPVHVLVSGNLPDSCAQLSETFLTREGQAFNLQLYASLGDGEDCLADSLPFRAEIPLNVAGLTPGSYQVNVNGMTASFEPFAPQSSQQEFGGISLAIDPALGNGISGESLPEQSHDPDGPYWDAHPAFDLIRLEGYPVSQSIQEPQIAVYPVEAYGQVSPQASEILDRLQALLAEKPAAPEQVPSLPVINAGQIFLTKVAYLDFQNGSGVRFLAVYGQGANPLTNSELVYGFQGLTSDGRYSVSILLPVNHQSLPADTQALGQEQLDAILVDYAGYQADTRAALETESEASFNPGLEALDALVASLQVDK